MISEQDSFEKLWSNNKAGETQQTPLCFKVRQAIMKQSPTRKSWEMFTRLDTSKNCKLDKR